MTNGLNNNKTGERFAYEWDKYDKLNKDYEEQFLKWIAPFGPKDFCNKVILDAGCGMGRNSFWALKYKAKQIIAFDCEEKTVKAAQKNLANFENVKVVYKSIYEIDWLNEFDFAFSIGVIHHLENPKQAILNLVKAVKPGGLVLIWVYGYEGNEWLVKYINPIRKHITSKLPLGLLHMLTYFLSLPLWLYLKIIPQNKPYFKQIKAFKFWHLHSIAFDQLLPKIANYYKKDEALALLKDVDLKNIGINPCNNNSWTVYGYKS